MILAIDPGPEQSAMLSWDGSRIAIKGIYPNDDILHNLRSDDWNNGDTLLAIEMIASYGMPVGKETFETCVWIGRFIEGWSSRSIHAMQIRLNRQEIKMHLCQSMRAKDSNIRQALIDRFGQPGTKKQPGMLYGVKSHLWAALAIAVTAHDRITHKILAATYEGRVVSAKAHSKEDERTEIEIMPL